MRPCHKAGVTYAPGGERRFQPCRGWSVHVQHLQTFGAICIEKCLQSQTVNTLPADLNPGQFVDFSNRQLRKPELKAQTKAAKVRRLAPCWTTIAKLLEAFIASALLEHDSRATERSWPTV